MKHNNKCILRDGHDGECISGKEMNKRFIYLILALIIFTLITQIAFGKVEMSASVQPNPCNELVEQLKLLNCIK